MGIVHLAQVEVLFVGRAMHRGGLGAGLDGEGVEEAGVHRREAELLQARGQDASEPVRPLSDGAQTLGAVVHGVHAGHDGEQRLGGADVGRGLLAADVLLAGLERQTQGRLALAVHGDAHEAPRHGALELVLGGEIGGMRSAETHGHTEALAVAHRHVRAPLARRREQREGQEIGGGHHRGTLGMQGRGERAVIAHVAVDAGILEQCAEAIGLRPHQRPCPPSP